MRSQRLPVCVVPLVGPVTGTLAGDCLLPSNPGSFPVLPHTQDLFYMIETGQDNGMLCFVDGGMEAGTAVPKPNSCDVLLSPLPALLPAIRGVAPMPCHHHHPEQAAQSLHCPPSLLPPSAFPPLSHLFLPHLPAFPSLPCLPSYLSSPHLTLHTLVNDDIG